MHIGATPTVTTRPIYADSSSSSSFCLPGNQFDVEDGESSGSDTEVDDGREVGLNNGEFLQKLLSLLPEEFPYGKTGESELLNEGDNSDDDYY